MGWSPLRAPSGKLSSTAPCRHPRCTRAVAFRNEGRGRLQEFCSDSCRVTYLRDRTFLLNALDQVQSALKAPLSPAERAGFKAEARFLKWHLNHYGGSAAVDEQTHTSTNPTDSPVSPSTENTEGQRDAPTGDETTDGQNQAHPGNPRPAAHRILALTTKADPTTRAWLARHPECPQEVMRLLSKDPDPRVRRSLAERTDLPMDVHRRLRRDRAASVRSVALATALN